MEVTSSTRLGCGRDIDAVWDNINHPPTAHEITCPDCRAARNDLRQLKAATADLHAGDDADADLQASPEVITRILSIARSEVRRGRRLPLRKPLPGDPTDELTVSEQALAAVIRRAGDDVPGIQIRRCTVELVVDRDETLDEVEPITAHRTITVGDRESSDVSVGLRVSVDGLSPIVRLVDTLRSTIIDVIDREVGMKVVAVDVSVEDVHDA